VQWATSMEELPTVVVCYGVYEFAREGITLHLVLKNTCLVSLHLFKSNAPK